MTVDWLVGPLWVWPFALIAVHYLRYDALVWTEARAVLARRQSLIDFYRNARDCDVCASYWLSIPALVVAGPAVWLAVNGAYLLVSKHYPTLEDPPDLPEEEPPEMLIPVPPPSPSPEGGHDGSP